MKPSPLRDFVVGLFVLAALASIAYLSLRVGGLDLGSEPTMTIVATFDDIGGLKPRSQVSIGGVKVGRVRAIGLDEALRARVELEVPAELQLPIDTIAGIRTSGLLGDQFIALEPGGDDVLLQDGESVDFVENALSLERLIGKFVHDSGLDEG